MIRIGNVARVAVTIVVLIVACFVTPSYGKGFEVTKHPVEEAVYCVDTDLQGYGSVVRAMIAKFRVVEIKASPYAITHKFQTRKFYITLNLDLENSNEITIEHYRK